MAKREVPAARIVFSAEDRRAVLALVDESLRTGSLTLGPHTRRFEEAFAARHDAAHAVAVSSGTSALEIILRAIGVDGREVVVPTNTFFASAAAVVHAGGTPRLAEVSASTLALSAETVEAALTPDTAAVMLVHIGGLISPEVDAIRTLCDERGVLLVEDAAHAHGSSHDGRPAGSFGHAAAFSFYPTKVLTSGEGGMIVTGDAALRDEAVIYRDQGKAGFLGGDHVRMGSAWRMSELHAAVGLVHLGRLDEAIATRQAVAERYDKALADLGRCEPVEVPDGSVTNYYKYVALLEPGIDRAALVGASQDYRRRLHVEQCRRAALCHRSGTDPRRTGLRCVAWRGRTSLAGEGGRVRRRRGARSSATPSPSARDRRPGTRPCPGRGR